jgi:uncharacterized protein YjdB
MMVKTVRNLGYIVSMCLFFIMFWNVNSAFSKVSTSTASVNLTVGLSENFTVTGGTGFYKVASSDPNVAKASIGYASPDKGQITGISTGKATITITDSNGDTATIAVQVSKITLSQTAVLVPVNASETVTILTSGTYTVSSSDAQVATTSVAKDLITITGVNTGTAVITVSDANKDSTKISVTVGKSLTVNPSVMTLSIGETADAVISGSTGGASITSSDPKVAKATLSGDTITVKGVASGTAVITAKNSAGFSAVLDVTVDTSIFVKVNLGVQETLKYSVPADSYQVSNTDDTVALVYVSNAVLHINGISPGKTSGIIINSQSNKVVFEVLVRLPAPVLKTSVNGAQVKFTWGSAAKADWYRLYHVPVGAGGAGGVIDPAQIKQANIGNVGYFILDLPSGIHYYVAIQAVHNTDPDMSSLLSNIEKVIVP